MLRIAATLGAWLLLTAALGAVTGSVLWGLEHLLLALAGTNLTRVLLVVAVLWSVNLLATAALSFAGITTHCLLVSRLYFEARGEAVESPSIGRRARASGDERPRRKRTKWLSGN